LKKISRLYVVENQGYHGGFAFCSQRRALHKSAIVIEALRQAQGKLREAISLIREIATVAKGSLAMTIAGLMQSKEGF
jgi:hypothetical protein